MTSPTVCVAENLVIGPDGQLRMAPWSVPRHVVDVLATSGGDTTKLLPYKTLPGRLLIDRKVQWHNDSPVDHMVRVLITRRWKRWVSSNPNVVEFRDRWSSAITPADADIIEAAEPVVGDTFNGRAGGGVDIGTNTVAEPNPGKYWFWYGTNTTEEWLGPVKPNETLRLWYRANVWTPPPYSDNANRNSPAHEAESGWSRIELMAFPEQGKLVTG